MKSTSILLILAMVGCAKPKPEPKASASETMECFGVGHCVHPAKSGETTTITLRHSSMTQLVCRDSPAKESEQTADHPYMQYEIDHGTETQNVWCKAYEYPEMP